jgi:hypothetical protein
MNDDMPLLGLATTEQLMRELITRFVVNCFGNVETLTSIDRALKLAEMLGGMNSFDRDYRTVEPRA